VPDSNYPRIRSPRVNRMVARVQRTRWRMATRSLAVAKRLIDLAVVVPALVLLSPLFAAVALAIEGDAFIEIQGHTDSIGSESYNLELGYKRAESAMRYLNMEQGIPLFRMNVISYGEFKPIADNATKEGRAQNRRVTLVAMQ